MCAICFASASRAAASNGAFVARSLLALLCAAGTSPPPSIATARNVVLQMSAATVDWLLIWTISQVQCVDAG